MCGVAGKLIFNDLSTVNPDLLQNMIGIVNHRGPDECGYYIDDNIGLGHARLSIIDLSGGTQPIHNENKTLWIVYNGEVFTCWPSGADRTTSSSGWSTWRAIGAGWTPPQRPSVQRAAASAW